MADTLTNMLTVSSGTQCSGQTSDSLTYYVYTSNAGKCVAIQNSEDITVYGKFKNSSSIWNVFSGELHERYIRLAIEAINNRTRERNFARLNNNLAIGLITEEEFDQELNEHEDQYVIKCNKIPSEFDLKASLQLCKEIMDVNDTDEMSMLFSFDESTLKPYLLNE